MWKVGTWRAGLIFFRSDLNSCILYIYLDIIVLLYIILQRQLKSYIILQRVFLAQPQLYTLVSSDFFRRCLFATVSNHNVRWVLLNSKWLFYSIHFSAFKCFYFVHTFRLQTGVWEINFQPDACLEFVWIKLEIVYMYYVVNLQKKISVKFGNTK